MAFFKPWNKKLLSTTGILVYLSSEKISGNVQRIFAKLRSAIYTFISLSIGVHNTVLSRLMVSRVVLN